MRTQKKKKNDYELYLAHHGVKGQRWGVRRYQNEDGSLTSKGKNRYSEDTLQKYNDYKKSSDKTKSLYKKTLLSDGSRKTQAEYAKSAGTTRRLKKDYKDSKIKDKLTNYNKSKHFQKLEQKYKEKGMTDEYAAIAAYKRVRAEKIILAVGATTMVAAAAYVGKNHYDQYVDKIIKKDTVMATISRNPNKNAGRTIYAAINKHDKDAYAGLYGYQLGGLNGQKVYKLDAKALGDIKVASPNNARKHLEKTINNDPKMRSHLINLFHDQYQNDPVPDRAKIFLKAKKSLFDNKIDKNVYEAFNIELVNHNYPNHQNYVDKFYNTLKKSGYGAIKDVNDSKYSGYNTKNPMIVFGARIHNNNKQITKEFISRSLRDYNNHQLKLKNIEAAKIIGGKAALSGTAIAGTLSLSYNLVNKSWDKYFVKEYKKEHPNSKLSDEEILDNVYRER